MTNVRETYFDVAKFVAMLTIVFIHVRTYAPEGADVWPVVCLENFVTTFVLPLFVLISGYFSRKLFEACDFWKLVRRMVACLWPVLSMNVLVSSCLGLALYGYFAKPEGGWMRYVLTGGWFFFCLAICDCLTFFAHRVSGARKGVLAGVLLVEFGILLALPIGLCHARDMIPHFWFGLYVYPMLRRVRFGSHLSLLGLAVFILACCLLPDFRSIGLNVHTGTVGGMALGGWSAVLFIARVVLGLIGALGVLELVRIVTRPSEVEGLFAWLGSQTMSVFFIHIQLLIVYYRLIGWSGYGLAGRFAIAVVVFLIAHALAVLTRMNPVVNAFLWNPLAVKRRRIRNEVSASKEAGRG